MPSYAYLCPRCGLRESQMHGAKERPKVLCTRCGWPMEWQFPCPGIVTDDTFMAGRSDDGFGNDERARKIAYANARARGINPEGKVYFPSLARKGLGGGRDPDAWVPHQGARSHIRKVCERNGLVTDRIKTNTPDPIEPEAKPYRVADDLVEREVNAIVARNKNDVTPKERAELKEQTAVRLAGNQE